MVFDKYFLWYDKDVNIRRTGDGESSQDSNKNQKNYYEKENYKNKSSRKG